MLGNRAAWRKHFIHSLKIMEDGVQKLRSVSTREQEITGDSLSIYAFKQEKGRWCRLSPAERIKAAHDGGQDAAAPESIYILTWNVDFASEQRAERLRHALDHIRCDVFQCASNADTPPPCCVLLQEVEAEVIPVLLAHEWVRTHFRVTPVSNSSWPRRAHYGNVTLVSRHIGVLAASSLVFENSHMARNALMVDLQLFAKETEAEEGEAGPQFADEKSREKGMKPVKFRIANVHLESLPQGAKARPEQLALVAQALKDPSLHGGLVGGDMNAIGMSDISIPKEVGLLDAYTGDEHDIAGHTWGYQPREAFLPGRLDKILYTHGAGAVDVEQPRCIGVGLKTADGIWASDHYGLLAIVRLYDKCRRT